MDVPFYHAMIKYIHYWNAKSFTNAISMMDKLITNYMSNKNHDIHFFPVNIPRDARMAMPPPSH